MKKNIVQLAVEFNKLNLDTKVIYTDKNGPTLKTLERPKRDVSYPTLHSCIGCGYSYYRNNFCHELCELCYDKRYPDEYRLDIYEDKKNISEELFDAIISYMGVLRFLYSDEDAYKIRERLKNILVKNCTSKEIKDILVQINKKIFSDGMKFYGYKICLTIGANKDDVIFFYENPKNYLVYSRGRREVHIAARRIFSINDIDKHVEKIC